MTKKTRGRNPRRIDVHHHIIPDEYVKLLATIGIQGTVGRDFPKWSPKTALRIMDRNGIETAMLSMSLPGTYFVDDEFSRKLTRVTNETLARYVADYPGRFGAFASLPLPDVDGALAEIDHAFDTLGLDGVALMTNVDGVYLGDPGYARVFAELDRRRAVVFVHPNDLVTNENPTATPLFERPIETTRTVANLLQSGTLERFPNVRYILAHGGGVVPFLAERIAAARGASSSFDRTQREPVDVSRGLELLSRLYYDTSQPGPALFASVRELAKDGHVLFGTDAGWGTPIETIVNVGAYVDARAQVFDDDEALRIDRANALALFPRLADVEA